MVRGLVCLQSFLMVWKVELRVQVSSRWLPRWLGRTVGPWREFTVTWADRWEDIPDRIGEVETGGLYHRLLLCCEEYEEDEDGNFHPVDQV